MKYKIFTYGCQMNVHESEKLQGLLDERGYVSTDDEQNADILVFNTCCIRDSAETKILGNVGSFKQMKEKNHNLIIAVLGCMTEQESAREKIKKSYPYVDIVLGTFNSYDLVKAIDEVLTKKKRFFPLYRRIRK